MSKRVKEGQHLFPRAIGILNFVCKVLSTRALPGPAFTIFIGVGAGKRGP